LPQAQLANLWNYADGVGAVPFISEVEGNEVKLVEKSIERFEKLCVHNGIEYRVHRDFFDVVPTELKKESRYADLLILGSELFYENMSNELPGSFLKDALHDVSCPVVIVPEKFDFPESIILGYDGSEDSVYAIKQFAYLFPELADLHTLLVYANEDPEKDFPDKIEIEELAARHFNDLSLFRLDVNPKKFFATWVIEKKSTMLVSGSYGRSGLSQLFKKSFIRDVIASHRLPVFVAHK
jgi:nucleotide-binding universal stress UspA family protein